MRILGIETSCDETAAAVVELEGVTREEGLPTARKSVSRERALAGGKRAAGPHLGKLKLLSNVVSSSLKLHAKTGGIIPESAAREQVKLIIPVINQAIKQSNNGTMNKIDAIAVTIGPGLMGSLLVGVETAKTLGFAWKKSVIPVNHLIGHIYANWVASDTSDTFDTPQFPCIGLIVSGGHTDLVLMKNHGKISWLGGTRDDAAGEAFDKIGRLLGLSYPGGPAIEKAASNGDPEKFKFPRPMIDSGDFDFSFSGLKTAVLREISLLTSKPTSHFSSLIPDFSASVQQAIIDVLVKKTLDASKKFKTKSILLGGGVAANQKLRDEMKLKIENLKLKIELFVPSKSLCTDNAAMIAATAFYNFKPLPFSKITANPQLYFD